MTEANFEYTVAGFRTRELDRLTPLMGDSVISCGAPAIPDGETFFPVVGSVDRNQYQLQRFGVALETQLGTHALTITPPDGHTIGRPFYEGGFRRRPFDDAERRYTGYSALVATVDTASVLRVTAFRLAGLQLVSGEPEPLPFEDAAAEALLEAVTLSLRNKVQPTTS